ncbi:MAG: class I SAM-dependent methyltransferase [Betaproteobacteria bacterium]|nr:class I SAM-dependent methyltransferase [Betaproteobacteria bacterium]
MSRTEPLPGEAGMRCGACGSPMRHSFDTRDYNHAVSGDVFGYSICTRCKLASLENVPDDLGPYYVSGYHTQPATDAAVEAGVAHEQYKIDLVRRFAPSGRLLEIGPSWGAFCLLAKRAGFSVEAIEMDPSCCEFLKRRIGVKVICRSDEADALSEATVPDVIAAWHVLEHLRNPWRLVDAAAERLAPGGALILALPNPGALQFKVFGRYWTHVDAPRHLHLIPPDVLRSRAERAGLRQEMCTTTDAGSLGWNEFGWAYSIAHLASGAFAKRVLRFAGRKISTLTAFAEAREGAGSAYTSVFRKPA